MYLLIPLIGNPFDIRTIELTEEKVALKVRMRASQALSPEAQSEKKSIKVKDLLQSGADAKMWPHLITTFVCLHPALIYNLFGPTIIRSFGFDALRSNALASVGQWCNLVLLVSMGFVADWWGHRGALTMITTFITFIMVVSTSAELTINDDS